MEFWNKNLILTTTMLSVSSGTVTATYLMTRDVRRQWISDGANDDSITATVTVAFDETTTISRIALDGMNVKKFNIYYNGATANTLALSSGATTTSQWTNNSEGAMALAFTQVDVTSLTFDFYSTQTANAEKAVGWLAVTSHLLDFEKVPASGSYTPTISAEQKEHKLSDGGTRIHTVDHKFSASIKLKYVSESFRESLYDIWRSGNDVIFMAFPTTTSWDQVGYECVWTGKFDFLGFADDASTAGFDGTITLKEVSR